MEPVTVGFLTAGCLGSAVLFRVLRFSQWADEWRMAAGLLRISCSVSWGLGRISLEGYFPDSGLSLTAGRRGGAHYIRLRGLGADTLGLVLAREDTGTGFKKIIVGEDFQTGDWAFDKSVYIEAPSPAMVLACLDKKTRDDVFRLVADEGARVEGGEFLWESSGSFINARQLVERVHLMAALAGRLAVAEADIPPRLARNAREDQRAETRLRNLTILQERYPSLPESIEASREALTDSEPAVRLQAASFLKEEGLDVLLALYEWMDDPSLSKALARMPSGAFKTRADAFLTKVMDCPQQRESRKKVIEKLGLIQCRPALEKFFLLAEGVGSDTMEEIVKAVGWIGGTEAEARLIGWLGPGDVQVRVAAAKALGEAGTVAAVEPLLKRAESGMEPDRLRRQARAAIGRIQERIGHGAQGGLSLAEPSPHDGALSLGGGGEVSLPEDSDQ